MNAVKRLPDSPHRYLTARDVLAHTLGLNPPKQTLYVDAENESYFERVVGELKDRGLGMGTEVRIVVGPPPEKSGWMRADPLSGEWVEDEG